MLSVGALDQDKVVVVFVIAIGRSETMDTVAHLSELFHCLTKLPTRRVERWNRQASLWCVGLASYVPRADRIAWFFLAHLRIPTNASGTVIGHNSG